MGAGVARQIKEKLLTSEEFLKYRKICAEYGSNLLGTVQILSATNGKLIANLFGEDVPTGKDLDTSYLSLGQSLWELKKLAEKYGMSIAIPGYIGCGLAGGDWNIVSKIIYEIFEESTVIVELCFLPENKGGMKR